MKKIQKKTSSLEAQKCSTSDAKSALISAVKNPLISSIVDISLMGNKKYMTKKYIYM